MSPLHSAASFHPSKLVAPTNFCRPNSWSPSSHLLANPSPEERLATQWAPSSAPNSTMVAGGWCLWLSTQATFGAWEAVGSSHRGGPPNLYLPICIMVGGSRPMGKGGMHAMELDGCPGRDSLAPGTDTPQWPWLAHTIGHLQGCGGPEPQERGAWLDHRPLQARCLLEQGVVPGSQKSRNWGFPEP